MSSAPQLSIVVPVYNAAPGLEVLAETLLNIPDVTSEVIFVEDNSTDGSAEIVRRLDAQHPNVRALFHDSNRGAGHARNAGFAHVRGTYTLFFDADDHIHGEVIAPALAQLDATEADLAIFPYRYERELDASHVGMNLGDVAIWQAYVGTDEMVSGPLTKYSRLLGFTNYPWNKIARTAMLQACGLRYGRTSVNNDILGHWYSLLFAKEILLINQVICTHVVHSAGTNLTNQHSTVRLQLFDALTETYDMLCAHPALRRRYAHHYWGLVLRVSKWARVRISPDMTNEFNLGLQTLVSRIDLGDYGSMRVLHAPAQADAISKILLS